MAEAVEDEVVAAWPLRGGRTSAIYALELRSGAELVLRRIFREPWRRHAVELLKREAAPWRDAGRTDLDDELGRERLEAYVESNLRASSSRS